MNSTPQHWQTQLAAGDVVIIDGGTGSELRRRGVALDAAAWSAVANLEHGGLLADIHYDYLLAGARIVTANTFAGSRFVLEAAGLADRLVDVNTGALAAAHEARKRAGRPDVAIAASLSCLPPRFDPDAWPDSATEAAAYRELATLFANQCADQGADLIILEMMQEPVHARLAADAALSSGLPVWLGLSCRMNAAGELTGYDFPSVTLDDTLDSLLDFDFALIAVMHSPPDAMVAALQRIGSRWSGPLGAWAELEYSPGAPSPHAPAATHNTVTPSAYADLARQWATAGAQVLGGCCGTTPAHIAALAANRRRLREAFRAGRPGGSVRL